MLREALVLLRRSRGEKTRTLQVRLFAFFAMFAIALVGAGFLILTMTGVFNTAESRHLTWMEAQTGHVQNSVSNDYSKLSLRGVSFARALSSDIQLWVQKNGISEKELSAHPELLESLLSEQAGSLLTVLDNNVCSGAFIMLDATVNPAAENAADKNAGLYFSRTNTNNLSSVSSKTHCLRGPAEIARTNGLELMGQWRMEFDRYSKTLFTKVTGAARQNSDSELSRLYYWSNRFIMDGHSEHVMLLCVPLIARDKTVYGMCGMEVSDMLFKRLYSPDSHEYPRIFSAFAPADGDTLDTGKGLIAGNSYLTSQTIGLLAKETRHGDALTKWRSDPGAIYIGLTQAVRLYPSGSPYEHEPWSLSILMPVSDWDNQVNQSNFSFYGVLTALLAVSLLAAMFISRRYIRPVVSALELIKSDSRSALPKTQITEIDDFLEYLAGLDEERKSLSVELERVKTAGQEQLSSATTAPFEQFLKRLDTLTTTERAVFNLYMEDDSAQQIADKLFVTINTIKFHNKNIYGKLGVSSLKELKVYVNMIKGTPDGG